MYGLLVIRSYLFKEGIKICLQINKQVFKYYITKKDATSNIFDVGSFFLSITKRLASVLRALT